PLPGAGPDAGNGGCDPNATCMDSSQGPVCTCKTGYSGDGQTCTPVNKCAVDGGPSPCGTNETCTATGPGTFSCKCSMGYAMTSNGDGGTSCQPVNPCTGSNPPCQGPNESCKNTGPD